MEIVRRARRLRPRAGRGLMATALSPYVGYQMKVRREVLVAVVERV
jgi:hypothetical protein